MTQQAADGAGIPHYPLVIDGRRTESGSGRSYQTIDPFLQTAWATAADGDAGDVDLAVTAARRALSGPWGKLTGFGRAQLIRRLGDILARDADALAEIETRDTGKLLREMRGAHRRHPGSLHARLGSAGRAGLGTGGGARRGAARRLAAARSACCIWAASPAGSVSVSSLASARDAASR
jgi:hypothetical protein